jgi:actin-like ATPase involved in cell morphogenesis
MPRAKIERIYRNLEHGRSGDEVAPAWHASMMERMELEGIVGQANHAGKREILVEEEDSAAEIGPGRIIFTEKRYLLWSKAR